MDGPSRPQEPDAAFRALFDVSLDVVVVIDPGSGQILEVNPAARPILGYERDDLVGRNASTLFPGHRDDAGATAEGGFPAMHDATFSSREVRRADGSTCPVEMTMAMVPWGGRTAIVASLREITERQQQEAAIEEARREVERARDDLRSILDQLRVGTLMTDAHGRVSYLSAAAETLLGTSLRQAQGQPWSQVCPLEPGELAGLAGLLTVPPARRTRTPVVIRTPDGRRFWTEVDVLDDPRDPARKIFVFYDVSEMHDLRRLLDGRATLHEMVGRSPAMLRVFQQIRDVAGVEATVLIEGETGTGKEMVARAIHYSGARKHGPFIPVNCAGLTESLLASQLFGHRRGSFTGAIADQQGVFEAAHHGTLFLDEVGDVPLAVQMALLRVLQEREIVRIGESTPRRVDVRVLAATHHDLAEDVAHGRFRADLLYRLRVARIRLPPLRERREDIPLLVHAFLTALRAQTGKRVEGTTPAAMERLLANPWPGNVRELRSALEFAVIHARGTVIDVRDLPPEVAHAQAPGPGSLDPADAEVERIRRALAETRGNRVRAARLLGIGRATLYRRLAERPDLAPPRRRAPRHPAPPAPAGAPDAPELQDGR